MARVIMANRVRMTRAATGTQGTYDPTADPAKCKADGYYFCTIENRCLPTTLSEAADIQREGARGSNSTVYENTHYNDPGEPYNGHYVDVERNKNPFGGYYEFTKQRPYPNDPVSSIDSVTIDASDSPAGGGYVPPTGFPPIDCNCPAAAPIFNYEVLAALDEEARLVVMRDAYRYGVECYGERINNCSAGLTDENRAVMEEGQAALATSQKVIDDQLLQLVDGVPTSPQELMSTFLGDTRDKLSGTTRRTRPMGTIIKELDTYTDVFEDCFECTPDASHFKANEPDEIADPDLTVPPLDIKPREYLDYTDWANKDKYDEEHESCLKDIPCTYPELEHPELELEEDPDPDDALDVDISDSDITSGCANGTGLFDKLMTAIDSSIDLQFKNSRLDAKAFGEFYASAIGSAMQQTTGFLIQKKQLILEAEKVRLEAERFKLGLDKHKYEKMLNKLGAEKVVLEMNVLKKKLPIELAVLVQQARGAESSVEQSKRNIEKTEADTVNTYDTIVERKRQNELIREETKVKIEQMKVQTKTSKFETILKKHQAYATKVQTEEAKATGASQRRIASADVLTKQKQASLADQQRKTYIYGQRTDVLKLMKDMWSVQMDTLGAEGMAVEAIKGPELSSKLERAGLDVGL